MKSRAFKSTASNHPPILSQSTGFGVKNIRIGPSLPAFVTPPVLGILADQFGIKPVTTPEVDLAALLG